MRNAVRMILVLVVVGLISGGALVYVYNYASPLIEINKAKELEESIYKVLPEAVRYNKIEKDGIVLYEGIDKHGKVIGYAFKARGFGYQEEIEIIAAIDVELKELKGIEVLESSETPGLGAKITEE
jgi:electron transport complex protein RnfG